MLGGALSRTCAVFLGAALLSTVTISDAAAQAWKWRDASGRVVYSDLPPPAGAAVTLMTTPPGLRAGWVPGSSARKAGADAGGNSSGGDASLATSAGGAAAPASGAVAATPGSAQASAEGNSNANQAAARPVSYVEKERLQRKEKEAQLEAAKKKEDEAKQLAERKRMCDDVRASLVTLDSGIRMQTVGADGERTVMDDDMRARKRAEIEKSLATHCKGTS